MNAQKTKPRMVTAPREVRLDLACGQNVREGFEGVDLCAPGAKHKLDLLAFPWLWGDESVDELHCSHFIEHIPMREIDGQDLFFRFFDECWRVLKKTDDPQKPLGRMTVICPSARSNRAFQDPTHRRFIVAETFLYLNRDWRKQNKLDHYRVRCHFGINVNPTIPQEISALHPEAQARRINENWNTTCDWVATLIAVK